MKVIDRNDFKMFVDIKKCKAPSELNAIQFRREEYNKDEDLILKNTYEFFLNKEDIKKLAKVLNDYE